MKLTADPTVLDMYKWAQRFIIRGPESLDVIAPGSETGRP